METIKIENTIEAKIKNAIIDRKARTFEKQVSFETDHGREVVKSQLKGVLNSFDEKTGELEIMKTENGAGEIVRISLYEINDIL